MASIAITSIVGSDLVAAGRSPASGEAGTPLLSGTADPGAIIYIYDTPAGGTQTLSKTALVDRNGRWTADYGYGPFLSAGVHYFQAYNTIATGIVTSATVNLGSDAADTLYGLTLAGTQYGSRYIVAAGGNDTIYAYTVVNDFYGGHSTGGTVSVDGQSGTDTVVLPDKIATFYGESRSGLSLTVTNINAAVTLLNVETLQFADYKITVRFDPLVDFFYYDKTYKDIAALDVDPRAHFAASGWHEGRNPNGFFSTAGYLSAYRDVAGAGLNPLQHYDAVGWKQGRDPSAGFDTDYYLKFNPDVKAANVDPLAHWLQSGQAEGRKSAPAVGSSVVAGFDTTYYDLAYADIGNAGVDAQMHFHVQGWKEGRNPDAFFDTSYYLNANPDVKAANIDPLLHYMQSGWKEGRDPSYSFSTKQYLAAYSDVRAAGINPLQHFLSSGLLEGRSAFGSMAITARTIV